MKNSMLEGGEKGDGEKLVVRKKAFKKLKIINKKKSEFSQRMNELHNRLHPKLLWISRHPKSLEGLTYVKKLHGELKA